MAAMQQGTKDQIFLEASERGAQSAQTFALIATSALEQALNPPSGQDKLSSHLLQRVVANLDSAKTAAYRALRYALVAEGKTAAEVAHTIRQTKLQAGG